jgi:hypothetical protein
MGDSYRMHDVILPQMTLEEEKEWFYWYKVIWPQIEDVIEHVRNN